jgi:hypothetical protein
MHGQSAGREVAGKKEVQEGERGDANREMERRSPVDRGEYGQTRAECKEEEGNTDPKGADSQGIATADQGKAPTNHQAQQEEVSQTEVRVD